MGLFGILNVNKPIGCTSRDVVNRVDRLVRPAKAGHAGTLDPLAAGVLVICVGQATRLIQYVHRMPKQYRATFLLGRRSETDDVEGEVHELAGAPEPTRSQLDQVLPQFRGTIEQRPPAHSAIKIGGRRAYRLARSGQPVELRARRIQIHSLAVERYEYPEVDLTIECGSGTYIRALGRDLAAVLGTCAVMSALERTAIGPLHLQDAVAIEALTAENLTQHFHPALSAVDALPRVTIGEQQLVAIRHGRPILFSPSAAGQSTPGAPEPAAGAEWAAVDAAGELVAILREKIAGQLWPALNFA